jgi:preprotein translocase subunit YajC
VVPGLIQSIDHPELLLNFVPILVLLVLWLIAFFFIRRRDRQKLQREIEVLRAFETANQA